VSKLIRFSCVAAPLALAAMLAGCGEAKQAIEISYDRPAAYQIPESVRKLAIAEFGGKTEADKRWGDIASDKLASELETYNRQFHRYQLVDRKRLRAIMDERDLQLAISDTATAGKIGKLANVDAMIYGNVTVVSRDEEGTRQVFDFANRTTRTVPYTKRYCMAAVNFTMDDIVTGKTLTTVTVTREYDSEKQNLSTGEKLTKAFGVGADKLAPVDQVLEDLVDQCVQEFVSKVSPHRIVVREKLMTGKSQSVETGNKLAAAGEYAEALGCYLQAVETKPGDDGAMFDAGLMYEAMGKLDKALEFYDRAFRVKDLEKYVLARRRVRVEAKGDESPIDKPAATSQPAGQAAAPKVQAIVSEAEGQRVDAPTAQETGSPTKQE
jgi:curli biogenesis system outer membrane secretion channel CsgG